MGSVITLDGYAQRFKRVNAIVHFLDDGFKKTAYRQYLKL